MGPEASFSQMDWTPDQAQAQSQPGTKWQLNKDQVRGRILKELRDAGDDESKRIYADLKKGTWDPSLKEKYQQLRKPRYGRFEDDDHAAFKVLEYVDRPYSVASARKFSTAEIPTSLVPEDLEGNLPEGATRSIEPEFSWEGVKTGLGDVWSSLKGEPNFDYSQELHKLNERMGKQAEEIMKQEGWKKRYANFGQMSDEEKLQLNHEFDFRKKDIIRNLSKQIGLRS